MRPQLLVVIKSLNVKHGEFQGAPSRIQQSPRCLEHGGAGIGKDLLEELSWDWEGPNIHRSEAGRNCIMSSLCLPGILSPVPIKEPWRGFGENCQRSRSLWESAPGSGTGSGCGGHWENSFIPGDPKSLRSGAGCGCGGDWDNPTLSFQVIPKPCLHWDLGLDLAVEDTRKIPCVHPR